MNKNIIIAYQKIIIDIRKNMKKRNTELKILTTTKNEIKSGTSKYYPSFKNSLFKN